MTAIKIVSLVVGLIALVMTFKSKLILEKLFKTEANERMVMRVKYTALILAVIAFLAVFILDK